LLLSAANPWRGKKKNLEEPSVALPSDQIPVGEGLDPQGNPGALFYISRAELDLVEQSGPEWKFEDARFIPEAAGSPDAIFEGLKRSNLQEGLCYSVSLTHDPDNEDSQTPPRFGYVFLAFVRPATWGYVVFDWAWREEDFEFPGHPTDWKNDFSRRTWHKT
jgi:hypothetical protein